MKRIIAIVLLLATALVMGACSSYEAETACIDAFMKATQKYDRQEMRSYLTEFPDNSEYVYVDDIFNDSRYVQLYQLLYKDLKYEIKKISGDEAVIKCKMPNIQELYNLATTTAMNYALADSTLFEKLQESEENGAVFTQELMFGFAEKGDNISMMEQEFTLSLVRENRTVLIECDDQLKALITGNFYLSRKMRIDDIK